MLFTRSPQRGPRPLGRPGLALEQLEPRCLLSYTITDVGTLGGSISVPRAMNGAGEVVGWANLPGDNVEHAFLFDGLMHDLGTLGERTWRSRAAAINSAGWVAGSAQTGAGTHAFLYDGVMHDLGTLPGYATSYAIGINDAGWVVGNAQTAEIGGRTHAFLYDGVMHDLGLLPGGLDSFATGINSAGQVVGNCSIGTTAQHAFLYDGVMQDLGSLGGAYSAATAINDAGAVVGSASSSTGPEGHAFLKEYGGTMIDVGGSFDGSYGSNATAVNAANWVVGSGDLGGSGHAFLYDGTFHDLGTLQQYDVSAATGINTAGQVIGWSGSVFRRQAFVYDGSMQDLGSLHGYDFAEAKGINDNGQIMGDVGGAWDQYCRAVLWTPDGLLRPAGKRATTTGSLVPLPASGHTLEEQLTDPQVASAFLLMTLPAGVPPGLTLAAGAADGLAIPARPVTLVLAPAQPAFGKPVVPFSTAAEPPAKAEVFDRLFADLDGGLLANGFGD